MKALAITSKGIENICVKEVKEILKAEAESKEGCVVFGIKNILDICKFTYKAQSVDGILFLFDNFIFNDFNDLIEKIKKVIGRVDFNKWVDKETTFRVSSKNIENNIVSEELNKKVGELIINKQKQKVDLTNPDIIFFVYTIKDSCYFGIDFSGFELNKRDYKIFNAATSLRATIAYALVRIADYKLKDVFLDPYSVSGEIAIEAALFANNFSHNFHRKDKLIFQKLKPLMDVDFDGFFENIDKKIRNEKLKIYSYSPQLMNVNNSRKNAQIAGVNKSINFSKVGVEDIDLKFKENTVDKIVAHLPEISRNHNEKQIKEIYKKFFHNVEYILKKNGKIVLLTKNKKSVLGAMEGFKITEERQVFSGQQKLNVICLEKSI